MRERAPPSHTRSPVFRSPFFACVDGRAFREAHGETIQAEFARWVENVAAGKSPIGFFKKLGELLRGTIADMQVQQARSQIPW